MLMCEELFLLLTTAEGGVEGFGTQRGIGVAGAVFTELVLAERVSVDDRKDPRFEVISDRPVGHPVLDEALPKLVERSGKKVSSVVLSRKFNPEKSIAASLADAGVVSIEDHLFGDKYPILEPAAKDSILARLTAVLRGEAPVSLADSSMLAILQALGVASKVLPEDFCGLSRRDLKARIKELGASDGAGAGVQKAIEALTVAVIAVTATPAG